MDYGYFVKNSNFYVKICYKRCQNNLNFNFAGKAPFNYWINPLKHSFFRKMSADLKMFSAKTDKPTAGISPCCRFVMDLFFSFNKC